MPLSVNPSGTTTWVPAKTAKVMVGGSWTPVKKMKTYVGSSWVLSWVHPVVNASLSLSKSSVITSETYNVTLTAPGGFPEGAEVVFRFTGYSTSVFPAEGATTATLTGASHASAGSYAWYADVKTKGGDTTFGPVTQSVSIVSTTVGLTGPSWVISTESGASGSSSAASKTFTITISNSAVVTSLSFQLSYAGGAWTQYASWGANPGSSVTHTMQFATAGSWRARAVATLSGSTVYSGEIALTCYKKDLACSASPSPAVVGDTVTLTAWHGGDGLGASFGQDGRWQYMYTSIGVWNDRWSTSNPVGWIASGVTDIQWRWIESYSDGSWILSNTVRVIVTDPYDRLNGGNHVDLEAAMRAAANAGRTLVLTGTFHLYGNAEIPANVNVIATDAKFNCNRNYGTYNRPGDAHEAGKFINDNGAGEGGYLHAGWFTWDGGEFDGNGESCMTISHSPGFTIKNATFYRYCANQDYFSWGDGHAIEVNSSGGPDNSSGLNGTFNVLIQGCSFLGTDMGQRAWGNDEPMHYDWSWDGSGGRAPYDGTMTHNMRVTGCTFHRYSEGATVSGAGVNGYTDWQWRFAICAIGAHNPGSTLRPTERHNHLQFDGNAIHGADGYRGGSLSFDKGAIHSHAARQVWVVNNAFYGCGGGNLGYQVTAQDSTDVTYNATPSGNTSNNGGYPNQWRVANG
jgi:hypothetical protein